MTKNKLDSGGGFPDETGKQEQDSATTALYRNTEGEWFTIWTGVGVSSRGVPQQNAADIASTSAEILTTIEACEFLDDKLKDLQRELTP